jgi:hypothetical protein
MLALMLMGSLVGSLRVLNTTFGISDATCEAGLWFGHCGFVLLFGTLLLKSWRVHAIVNNSNMRKKKITEKFIVSVTLGALLFVCVYLVMLKFVGQIHMSVSRIEVANQYTKEVECSFVHPEAHTFLFVIEACVVFVGSYLCYKTKDVPDVVNEAKPVAAAISIIVVLGVLVFPLVFIIGLEPVTRQFLVSVSIAMVIISSITILFVPKLFMLYTASKLTRGTSVRGAAHLSRDDNDDEPSKRVFDASDVEKMKIKDAIEFAQLQIAKWTAAHFRYQEKQFEKNSASGYGNQVSTFETVTASSPSIGNEDCVEEEIA